MPAASRSDSRAALAGALMSFHPPIPPGRYRSVDSSAAVGGVIPNSSGTTSWKFVLDPVSRVKYLNPVVSLASSRRSCLSWSAQSKVTESGSSSNVKAPRTNLRGGRRNKHALNHPLKCGAQSMSSFSESCIAETTIRPRPVSRSTSNFPVAGSSVAFSSIWRATPDQGRLGTSCFPSTLTDGIDQPRLNSARSAASILREPTEIAGK